MKANIIKRTTGMRNGQYGPSHDPYAWTECWLDEEFADGTKKYILVHEGLKYEGQVDDEYFNLENEGEKILFELFAGMTANELVSLVTFVDHETYKRLDEATRACIEADARMMANCY